MLVNKCKVKIDRGSYYICQEKSEVGVGGGRKGNREKKDGEGSGGSMLVGPRKYEVIYMKQVHSLIFFLNFADVFCLV